MLMRLLDYVRGHEGAVSLTDAAARLNVTPGLVEAMLDTLTRMGYLTAVQRSCDASECGACRMCGGGAGGGSTRTWAVTARGSAAR